MTPILKSLCWAAAFLLVAAGRAAGLIDDASAATLFAVLPALWIIALRGPSCAAVWR